MAGGSNKLLNIFLFVGLYCLIGLHQYNTDTKNVRSSYSITEYVNSILYDTNTNNSDSATTTTTMIRRAKGNNETDINMNTNTTTTTGTDLPYQKITRQIIQTFKVPYDQIQPGMKNATNTWKNLNPEYTYRYFDDDMMTKYVMDNGDPQIIKAYNSSMSGAAKCDLFRVLIIYLEGGIYADIDTTLNKPLREIIKPDDDAISGRGRTKRDLHQFFLAYIPGHPILGKTLLHAIQQDPAKTDVVWIAGPEALNWKAAASIVNKRSEHFNETYEQTPLLKKKVTKFECGIYYMYDILSSRERRPYHIRVLGGDMLHGAISFKYKGYKDEIKKANVTYWIDIELDRQANEKKALKLNETKSASNE